MKRMMFISVFVYFCLIISAQTPAEEILNRINYVFENVDRNNVATGLLSNYGVQPIPIITVSLPTAISWTTI